MGKSRSEFTRYCTEGILSIDNNLAERTLRPCARRFEVEHRVRIFRKTNFQ
ncbi:IS66 family transposase [Gimesia sp.]|uniref:IS66 family transposase n=1 Tax=Gimesia sp. TaxID=2024833 RepID=UPI003A953F82